jgi:hypothetical protein
VRSAVAAFLVDAFLVLVFATVGRASHDEALSASGILAVAWPFLVALAVGWAVARVRGGWPVRLAGAMPVWLVTVVLGLTLRVLSGGGFAWSFGVVTLLVLGLFLLGWRCAIEAARFGGEGLARWSAQASRR